ncbi:MAG: hypothetical protein RL442_8 [Pseudomonadota bacterium]|jgi:hypothetical protein
MDWEMKASQLAEDLGLVALGLLGACVWLWFEVDGWVTIVPVVGAAAAINAIVSSAKIKP